MQNNARSVDAKLINHTAKSSVYRQRAEQLRTLAPGLNTETSREIFFRLAGNYERLAEVENQLAWLEPGEDRPDAA